MQSSLLVITLHDLLTKRKRELPVNKESIAGGCVCKSVCVCVPACVCVCVWVGGCRYVHVGVGVWGYVGEYVGVCASVLCVWHVCGVVCVCNVWCV